jgi:hypothetical protein
MTKYRIKPELFSEFYDCVIRVKDPNNNVIEKKCHKIILASQSHFFLELFRNMEQPIYEIDIPFDLIVFERLFKQFYKIPFESIPYDLYYVEQMLIGVTTLGVVSRISNAQKEFWSYVDHHPIDKKELCQRIENIPLPNKEFMIERLSLNNYYSFEQNHIDLHPFSVTTSIQYDHDYKEFHYGIWFHCTEPLVLKGKIILYTHDHIKIFPIQAYKSTYGISDQRMVFPVPLGYKGYGVEIKDRCKEIEKKCTVFKICFE